MCCGASPPPPDSDDDGDGGGDDDDDGPPPPPDDAHPHPHPPPRPPSHDEDEDDPKPPAKHICSQSRSTGPPYRSAQIGVGKLHSLTGSREGDANGSSKESSSGMLLHSKLLHSTSLSQFKLTEPKAIELKWHKNYIPKPTADLGTPTKLDPTDFALVHGPSMSASVWIADFGASAHMGNCPLDWHRSY